HEARDVLVLERLVRHHVAPVTRGVPDAEEDRLVLARRALERSGSPRVPLHRIAGVLEEVGGGFGGEVVHGLKVVAGRWELVAARRLLQGERDGDAFRAASSSCSPVLYSTVALSIASSRSSPPGCQPVQHRGWIRWSCCVWSEANPHSRAALQAMW